MFIWTIGDVFNAVIFLLVMLFLVMVAFAGKGRK